MDLINPDHNPHKYIAFGVHLVMTIIVAAAEYHVLYNFSLDSGEFVFLGVVFWVSVVFGNIFLSAPISWFSKRLFDSSTVIFIRLKKDFVSVVDICTHIYSLRNDFGWRTTVGVDSWCSDGKIVFDFVQGNCANQFSINMEDFTTADSDTLYGFHKTKYENCDACCSYRNDKSSKIYLIKSVRPAATFTERGLLTGCCLCGDCLDDIVQTGLNKLESDVYADIAANSV